jgi:hypothetical protein
MLLNLLNRLLPLTTCLAPAVLLPLSLALTLLLFPDVALLNMTALNSCERGWVRGVLLCCWPSVCCGF